MFVLACDLHSCTPHNMVTHFCYVQGHNCSLFYVHTSTHQYSIINVRHHHAYLHMQHVRDKAHIMRDICSMSYHYDYVLHVSDVASCIHIQLLHIFHVYNHHMCYILFFVILMYIQHYMYHHSYHDK